MVGIEYHIDTVKVLADTVVSEYQHSRREKDECSKCAAYDSLEAQQEELFPRGVEIAAPHAEQVVYHQKYSLTCKEVVVYYSHESDGDSEYTSAALVYIFLHSNEHEREECGNVLKVIEKDVE